MAVYIVTGKLGNGKTLVTVGRIRDAIRAGCRIATNLDIDLVAMFGKQGRNIDLMRIPDKPSIDDLNAIGKGYDGPDYDEKKFGALVLDECGTWFNSRNWQDKTRAQVNNWFLHARKLGWHVYIIIQDISMLDSQARDAIGELLVTCRRLDNLRIPLIGAPIKLLTGINLAAPRVHRAKVAYSDGLVSDVWWYRGTDLFSCYDTRQAFMQDYPHGTYCQLTPWHTHGRYAITMNWSNIMRITKIYWKRFQSPLAMAIGLLLGAFFMLLANANQAQGVIQGKLHKFSAPDLTKPVAPPVASSSSSASSTAAPSGGIETRLAAWVDQLRIIGSYKLNNGISYQFSAGSTDHYFTSADLQSMGFRVSPVSDCSAMLVRNGQSSVVGCL